MSQVDAIPLDQIVAEQVRRFSSSWDELDFVYGRPREWGIPRGKISVWSGSPGVGKTRLVVEMVKRLDRDYPAFKTLIFQGELPPAQFAGEKMKDYKSKRILISPAVSIDDQICQIEKHRPDLVVTDSVQQVEEYDGGRGSKEVVRRLREVIERVHCHVVFLSQVTIQGHTKGGTQLPHEVDVVVEMERDEHGIISFRVIKNRFGKPDQICGFKHEDWGVACLSPGRFTDSNWCRDHHIPVRTFGQILAGSEPRSPNSFLRRMGKVARKMFVGALVLAVLFGLK